jgi:hypothetical protein
MEQEHEDRFFNMLLAAGVCIAIALIIAGGTSLIH